MREASWASGFWDPTLFQGMDDNGQCSVVLGVSFQNPYWLVIIDGTVTKFLVLGLDPYPY